MAQAVTAGCRVSGLVTPTPSRMRLVTAAAAVRSHKRICAHALGVAEAQPVEAIFLGAPGPQFGLAGDRPARTPDLNHAAVVDTRLPYSPALSSSICRGVHGVAR